MAVNNHFREVHISVNESGIGKLLMDGVDISKGLRGFTITAEAGKMTTVELRYINCKVEGTVKAEVTEVTAIANEARRYIP